MNIDPTAIEAEVIAAFDQNKEWVLATAAQNRVTARTVSIVNIGLQIYFLTDKTFMKSKQIEIHPQVAFCHSNIQIEGAANFNGSCSASSNQRFCELYQKHHPSAFARYAHLADEVVISVKPCLITMWKYIDTKPCRDFYDVALGIARREFYHL